MRICAISPFETADKEEILEFLRETTAELVLLPGNAKNTPSPEAVQSIIGVGVSVFVEGKGNKMETTPYLVTTQNKTPMPRQIFSQKPTAAQMDSLALSLPNRTFTIGSRSVTFFICGEIIAFNPDGSIKHGRKLPFDILANPAHSIMGHWNHLGRKLSNLSKRSAAVYATNNNYNHNSISTDVRIYTHGNLQSIRHTTNKIVWSECTI